LPFCFRCMFAAWIYRMQNCLIKFCILCQSAFFNDSYSCFLAFMRVGLIWATQNFDFELPDKDMLTKGQYRRRSLGSSFAKKHTLMKTLWRRITVVVKKTMNYVWQFIMISKLNCIEKESTCLLHDASVFI